MFEMDEDAPEIFVVLLDAMIQRPDVLLVEEAQHPLFELTAALAGDDLDEGGLLLDRLVDDAAQRTIDLVAPVENVVQVELQLHDHSVYGVLAQPLLDAVQRLLVVGVLLHRGGQAQVG